MKRKQLNILLIVLLLVVTNSIAQDFHQREAQSVEELIYRKDPNRAKTMFNKGRYLVLENLRTNSRKRFYVGDVFSFKTKGDFVFADDIYEIKDSSFVVTALNEVTNRYEYVEIRLDEVQRIYKHPKKKVNINLATFAPFGYLLFEWAYWKIEPWKSPKLPLAAGLSAAHPFFTILGNQFRSKKITENYRLRIFQSL
jgi:hypothetical protein